MKKNLLLAAAALSAAAAAFFLLPAFLSPKIPEQIVMTGNYYDYMVIETVDGCQWFLDNTHSPDNPYMKYENGRYVPVFEDSELVQVLFSTRGTADVTDDMILRVRSIDSRFPNAPKGQTQNLHSMSAPPRLSLSYFPFFFNLSNKLCTFSFLSCVSPGSIMAFPSI